MFRIRQTRSNEKLMEREHVGSSLESRRAHKCVCVHAIGGREKKKEVKEEDTIPPSLFSLTLVKERERPPFHPHARTDGRLVARSP